MNSSDQLLNVAQNRETQMYNLGKMVVCSGNIAGVDGSLAKETPTPLISPVSLCLVYNDMPDLIS